MAGIVSARTCENTVRDSKIVTPENVFKTNFDVVLVCNDKSLDLSVLHSLFFKISAAAVAVAYLIFWYLSAYLVAAGINVLISLHK